MTPRKLWPERSQFPLRLMRLLFAGYETLLVVDDVQLFFLLVSKIKNVQTAVVIGTEKCGAYLLFCR